MKPDIARHVLRAAFRSAAELQQVLPLLKENCTAKEYDEFRTGIATAIATVGDEVTNRILAANPGLSKEVDEEMKRYGRLL